MFMYVNMCFDACAYAFHIVRVPRFFNTVNQSYLSAPNIHRMRMCLKQSLVYNAADPRAVHIAYNLAQELSYVFKNGAQRDRFDIRFSLMTRVMTLELYFVVPGRAVSVNSGGGVDCTVKWAKTLYYGEIVGSGKLNYIYHKPIDPDSMITIRGKSDMECLEKEFLQGGADSVATAVEIATIEQRKRFLN